MVTLNVVCLTIVTALVFGCYNADATQIGCSHPEDRCLPIRHCLPVFKRIANREQLWNVTFKKEVLSRRCQPADLQAQMVKKTHICCHNSHIECRLNGEPGACLLREHCPTLNTTTEQKLLESAEQNLCYVHKRKNYFCCTDPYCAAHKKLCVQSPVPAKQPPSFFPTCPSANGIEGVLVPEMLCSDRSRLIKPAAADERRVCCVPPANPQRLIIHPIAAKLAQVPCGVNGFVKKIQNGVETQRGEFPWMAYLVYKSRVICSGTLIHPSYVLTARHCINRDLVRVRLGLYDLLESPNCPNGEPDCPQAQVQEIAIVEKIRSHKHDVGLLRLAAPATLREMSVQPICLPVYASLRMYLPQTVTITGWGLNEMNRRVSKLLKARTTVLNSETPGCTKDYMICVGGDNNSNHCDGDSGGPYQALGVYGEETRYVQYGVISDGSTSCGNPTRPSRGVLVGYVMEWILDNMKL
uniref:Peptidase S1 domain-containing protein n=1 Tax=Anopheles epiroticus TaxID=199890 RepID=A0A182PGK6_9DIPT